MRRSRGGFGGEPVPQMRAAATATGSKTRPPTERVDQNRLARASLARDRIQPCFELELRLTDEDEVLDAQAPKHEDNATARSR